MTARRERALCCECGNLRTVAANFNPLLDANRTCDDGDDQRGWRMTCTLKCPVCKTKTRHALLRAADKKQHRDFAELRESERRAVILQPGAENTNTPSYRIIEHRGATGRHPRSSRSLTAIDATSGVSMISASEYPEYWKIDVEHHTIKMAGMDFLSRVLDGFCVRSEDAAYDWLRLFGALAGKASQQSQGNTQ